MILKLLVSRLAQLRGRAVPERLSPGLFGSIAAAQMQTRVVDENRPGSEEEAIIAAMEDTLRQGGVDDPPGELKRILRAVDAMPPAAP